ncbi:MAG: chemotaxis protein [Comamonadaceae bacterium]|nr:MAG: chemotaxis protein [Comamonadaceae bacterium]
MKAFYTPAFWLLGRLSQGACFVLVALTFLLATLVALAAPGGVAWLPAALLALLGCYGLAAVREFLGGGIGQTIALMERIASGELVSIEARADASGADRAADRLHGAIAQMNRSLALIVRQVWASAETIAGGARSITAGNTQLAERTHQQAASLEETAAGVEQLAASARQNAQSCAQANQMAAGSEEVAMQASARMQDVSATMERIEANAGQVGEILATVEGFAFQTNILALNAAVEAARAGEHGRGFAVVAAEVRELAQRSALAAREIREIIAQTSSSVHKGRGQVAATGKALAEVVASIQDVSQMLISIAAASREQSEGVEEINRAVVAIDGVTQQNAALVEEAASSAEDLARESAQLVRAVGRFKTDRAEDRERAMALVKAGVRHLRKVGVQQACQDFMDPKGGFIHGEDYLFVVDMHCTRLAFPPAPETVGQDDSGLRDADGTLFSRQNVEIARTSGSGWNDFRVPHPITGRIEPKSAYLERVDEVVIGCGIYWRSGGAA